MVFMRTPLLVVSVWLALIAGTAQAQPAPATGAASSASGAPDAPLSAAEIKKRSDQYLTDCIGDWDKGTHMSKQDWTRTCRRVVQRRIDYMLQQEK
jgi:hypothetical protein